jgi:thioredoxin-related protein
MSRVFLLLALSTTLMAIEWKSWDAGIKQAKEENKIVMIDVVRTGCHYCDDMEKAVFDDAKMSAWIEKRFVPVKINISNEKLPLGLHASMTPSFYFISKEKKVLKKIPGSWNQEDFKSFLKSVHDE